jgi:hypothetical protein
MLKVDFSYKFDPQKPMYMQFKVGDRLYSVPYFGVIAKIIDFGFSEIPEEGLVSNATEDLVNMFYRSRNDALLLFHWIYSAVKNQAPGSDEIVKLLEKLEPNKTYVSYQTERIRGIEDLIPSYLDMVTNSVFDEYLIPPNGKIFGTYVSPP